MSAYCGIDCSKCEGYLATQANSDTKRKECPCPNETGIVFMERQSWKRGKVGYGGDKQIAELLNIDRRTVAKGRIELLNDEVDLDTIREAGGGRKQIKKKFQK